VHIETMGVPQARIVRMGAQRFAAPPAPRDSEPSAVRDQLRDVLALAIGMWPLTGVVLLALGLLWMAGMNSAP
jgi:nitrate reductase NapE component